MPRGGLFGRGLPRLRCALSPHHDGNPGDAKQIGRGIWELRLAFGPGYRIYYIHDGASLILLLCGGDKSTQQRDIDRAHPALDLKFELHAVA